MSSLISEHEQPLHFSPDPIKWGDGLIRLLDQTRLPWEEVFVDINTPQEAALAIREMRVRGAPAIGVVAAYGMVLASATLEKKDKRSILKCLVTAADEIADARPTAINLRWALDRMIGVADKVADVGDDIESALLKEALIIHRETCEADLRISDLGASLIQSGSSVLTHCNTGVLATGGYGTALGVIRRAWEEGKVKDVVATETRPWLQGARLTIWELSKLGIPCTLVVDSAAGYLMNRREVQAVIVGADRIATNGDVANKIGTYSLAVLAYENGIPFYVAAPLSTIDVSLVSGEDIPIEERQSREVTHINGFQTTVEGTVVSNMAFDITPSRYITAIITDRGIARPPYDEQLMRVYHV